MISTREPSTTEILREIRALRAEVAELRKPSRAGSAEVAHAAMARLVPPDIMDAITDAVDAQHRADRRMAGRPTS